MAEGKWISGLKPGTPIADAAKLVLSERFAVVRHYLPLAASKPFEDVEYVHQLRVGTRRAGAALRAFADALPRKPLKATKAALRTIRRAAGDARDWDVFLAALPGAKTFSTAPAKPALDFLLGYSFGQRAAAQSRLTTAETETGGEFNTLSEALPERAREPDGAGAPANFGALAAQQLGALLGDLSASTEANPTEAHALHALRITAKRLRYAIEIFADCFPPLLKDTIYPAVERVQEVLGEVQDANVSIARIADIRAHASAVMPKQLTRVKKGLDGLAASLRTKVPAGKKAFTFWRKEWLEMMAALKLEVVASVVTA
ncbi:CHAD domain-containing protein [Gemmata sp. G18]|uniref:CHAD domain-containing protein n=1 Tax=Gemmata palustris TaxID=2822762 RepID=A0ABS5BV57_9BACT|nr:CHAD domain-containing protein [Gemmata palustris]MBP3956788.1 CHAD domain-containing protein [Gemmata palustris]